MRIAFLFLTLVSMAGAASTADELLARAVSLAGAARLDEAEKVLLEGRSTFANDARFPAELAGVAFRKKQYARAKAYLRDSLRLDPSGAYANEFLGSLYLLDGNLFGALKYWNRLRRPILSGVGFMPEPPLRAEVAARIPAVSAGQLLTTARLSETERNLNRLQIFAARFDLTPEANGEYRLIIRSPVRSQPPSGIAGHLLPLLRGLPYQHVNLDWLNIGRRARSFTSLWRWDPDKRRIAAQYRAPAANRTYTVRADFRDEDWDLNWSGISPSGINIKSAAVAGALEFDLAGGKQWSPSIHLSRHTFRSAGLESWSADSTVWEIRNTLRFPRWRYAERRVYADSSITLRTGRIFSRDSSRLFGAEFDAAAQWLPQARDDLYAIRGHLRAGAVSGRLPLGELYIIAMERDTDLWLRGHTGTRHGRKGSAPMGTRFVLAQTEMTRRIMQVPLLRIDAGPFFDVGNTGGSVPLGSRGWLYDIGAQTVVTTLGRLRFSVVYGYDLRGGNNVLYTAFSR